MPLFLDADFDINVPLEETYMQAWQGFLPFKTDREGAFPIATAPLTSTGLLEPRP
jgi:hypothetical protein